MVVGDPFRHDIRAGADGVRRFAAKVFHAFHGLCIHDRHRGRGELCGKACIRSLQGDCKMGVVKYFKAGKLLCFPIHQLIAACDFKRDIRIFICGDQKTFKAVFHIGSCKGTAVRENNAVPQGKLIAKSVLADRKIRAEAALDLCRAVPHPGLEETVEYIERYHVVIRSLRDIHGRHVIQDRRTEQTILRRLRRRCRGC